MEDKKTYQQPRRTILNTIHDIMELQNAKITFSDTPNGKIHFVTKMYGNKWEHRLTVTDIDKNQCSVKIEIGLNAIDGEKQIKREFALLDSMLAV